MRLGLIGLFVALLLAAIAGQNSLLQPTEAEDTTSAITACAVQGESCPQPPLDSSPASTVLEHQVFVGACGASAASGLPPGWPGNRPPGGFSLTISTKSRCSAAIL